MYDKPAELGEELQTRYKNHELLDFHLLPLIFFLLLLTKKFQETDAIRKQVNFSKI